jgi:hypothetical protein
MLLSRRPGVGSHSTPRRSCRSGSAAARAPRGHHVSRRRISAIALSMAARLRLGRARAGERDDGTSVPMALDDVELDGGSRDCRAGRSRRGSRRRAPERRWLVGVARRRRTLSVRPLARTGEQDPSSEHERGRSVHVRCSIAKNTARCGISPQRWPSTALRPTPCRRAPGALMSCRADCTRPDCAGGAQGSGGSAKPRAARRRASDARLLATRPFARGGNGRDLRGPSWPNTTRCRRSGTPAGTT